MSFSFSRFFIIFTLAICSLLFASAGWRTASAAPSAPLLQSPPNSWSVLTTPGNVNFQWSYGGTDINNMWYYFIFIKWDGTKWLTVNSEYTQKNLSITKSLTDSNAFYAWQVAAVDITKVNPSTNDWYAWATDWNRLHIGNPATPTPTPTPTGVPTITPTPTPGGSPTPTPTPCPTCPTYYIAPPPPAGIGNNSNSGTSASSPWATFAYAIPKLQPGYTLILLDGTYTKTTTGLPNIICGTNAQSGTASSYITIKAQNERRAFIQSDGTYPVLNIESCSYWNVEGLHLQNADNPSSSNANGMVVRVSNSNNITLKRLIAEKNNRYFNTHGIYIGYSNNVLVEENEVYYFNGHGIQSWRSSAITYRRNYVNQRNYGDISGGYQAGGTEDYSFYKTKNSIAENNIAETGLQGFDVHADEGATGNTGIPDNNQLLGNIAKDFTVSGAGTGFLLDSRCNSENPCNTGDRIVNNNVYENNVAINTYIGYWMRGGQNINYNNSTSLNASAAGFMFDLKTPMNSYLSSTAYSTNSLDTGMGSYGFRAVSQSDWKFDYTNSFGNSTNFSPNDSHVTNSTQVDPQLGNCRIYIPNSSPMKGAGTNGKDIGANIVYRYQNGVLTNQKLWNQTTGQFPCGAIVPGVNDIVGSSCFDVNKRLNVGVNGCPIP